MVKREVWHVMAYGASANSNSVSYNGWKVKKEGNNEPSRKVPKDGGTKQTAINVAEDIAKNNKPSQIIVHKIPVLGKNGNILHPIDFENTYSKDPVRYEG